MPRDPSRRPVDREQLSAPDRSGLPDPAIDRRVLVIEDEPRLREMLTRAISEMDFQTASAQSAEAAMSALGAAPAGILILDLNLPGMRGLEFCELARKRWPETQVIILTGHGDLEAAKTAIHLDVVDFLTKPCTLGDLESALDRALRRRHERLAAKQPAPWVPPAAPERLDDLGDLGGDGATDTPQTLREQERQAILDALDRHGGNRAAAAEELGISVRTLYYRLREYDAGR